MKRRQLLQPAAAALLTGPPFPLLQAAAATGPLPRVRPADAAWPTDARWAQLGERVGGCLLKLADPIAAASDRAARDALFSALKHPHVIGDSPALTQTFGRVDAWTSRPSAWNCPNRWARST